MNNFVFFICYFKYKIIPKFQFIQPSLRSIPHQNNVVLQNNVDTPSIPFLEAWVVADQKVKHETKENRKYSPPIEPLPGNVALRNQLFGRIIQEISLQFESNPDSKITVSKFIEAILPYETAEVIHQLVFMLVDTLQGKIKFELI